jgi:tRNA pseudouridine55 synthase
VPKKPKWSDPSGILFIDKPIGWTSHDIIIQVRKKLNVRSAGHIGSLDPKASGLLVVLIGTATKLSQLLIGQDKTYEAEITLGASTPTDDSESEPVIAPDCPTIPSVEVIEQLLTEKFSGTILQVPPAHSAININGTRAYQYAREGRSVEMKERPITIHQIKIVSYKWPTLKIICDVSSGTYIRSIARDIGKELGCGGYLSQLRRTRIGPWHVEIASEISSCTIDKLTQLMPTINSVISILELSEDQAKKLRNGQILPQSLLVPKITGSFSEKGVFIGLLDGKPYILIKSHRNGWKPCGLFVNPNE